MTALTEPAGPSRSDATPERPAAPSRLRVSAPPGTTGPARRLDATRPTPVRRVRLGAPHTTPGKDEELPQRPLAPQPAPALPDPTAQCCSVVRAAVEVLRGERSAGQLARWVTPRVLDQLTERARLTRERGPSAAPSRPVLVRRVRLVRLGDDVAEATVVLDDDGRVRAAAVRLEARRGVWRVAVLELG
jgi:hypothetical protein